MEALGHVSYLWPKCVKLLCCIGKVVVELDLLVLALLVQSPCFIHPVLQTHGSLYCTSYLAAHRVEDRFAFSKIIRTSTHLTWLPKGEPCDASQAPHLNCAVLPLDVTWNEDLLLERASALCYVIGNTGNRLINTDISSVGLCTSEGCTWWP
jgi:hypothetical protein